MSELGERIAKVETSLGYVIDQLKNHDDATALLSDKLDTIIKGQDDGARDRAAIRAQLEQFRPHIETIQTAKTWWRVTRLLAAGGAAVIGFAIASREWLLENWNWFIGKS